MASSDPPDETERERLSELAQFDDECDDAKHTLARDDASKKRWADLEDSDGDMENEVEAWVGAGFEQSYAMPVMSSDYDLAAAVQYSQWQDGMDEMSGVAWATYPVMEATMEVQQVPPAASAVDHVESWEAQKEPQKKWGKHSTWTEPWSTVAPEARAYRQAGHRAQQGSPGHGNGKWWAQQWDTEDAQWWGGGAASAESWSSQRWESKHATKTSRCSQRGAPVSAAKPQCQFFIGIEEESKFRVTRKMLGPHGQHVKAIVEKSWAKLRLRGRGSGFLEGPEQQESVDELMLCVSAPDAACYVEAVSLVTELLEGVYEQYRTFCRKASQPVPELAVRIHEGPRPGSR